jgi:hypothetical protein
MGVKVRFPALQFATVTLQTGRQRKTSIKTTNNKVNSLPVGDLRPAEFAVLKEG